MASNVGSLAALWRYPIKSMQGEPLEAVAVTEHGLVGDRRYALVDVETGKVVSAKNPRRWPRMFQFRARYAAGVREETAAAPVIITAPDGTEVSAAQPDLDAVLSRALGRAVRLESAPPERAVIENYTPDVEWLPGRDTVSDYQMPAGRFFDLAPVHILTTASLAQLGALHPGSEFHPRRFRPNLLVETGEAAGFAENEWVGRTLEVGQAVRIRVTMGTARCVMTTLPQPGLPPDPAILRTVVQQNAGIAGVYGEVLQGGTIRLGDTVRLA